MNTDRTNTNILQLEYLHESKLMERTKAMCTPNLRCDPEHSKHMNAPIGGVPDGAPGILINEAQRGCRSGQSTQMAFSGRFMHTLRRFLKAD